MAQRIVRRRRLPSGVRELPDRGPKTPDVRPLYSVELVITSPASGQPVAKTASLPSGAELIAFSYVTEVVWPGTTAVLDLGDEDTVDRFYAAKNVKAEGSDYEAQSPHVNYPVGQVITATITTTGTAATGAKTRIRVFYFLGG